MVCCITEKKIRLPISTEAGIFRTFLSVGKDFMKLPPSACK